MNDSTSVRTRNIKLWPDGRLAASQGSVTAGSSDYPGIRPFALTSDGSFVGASLDTPAANWHNRAANLENLFQVQSWNGLRPHSIRLNCMAAPKGKPFSGCSVCTRKHWASTVAANDNAILRLGPLIYPVSLNRETDQAVTKTVYLTEIRIQTRPH